MGWFRRLFGGGTAESRPASHGPGPRPALPPLAPPADEDVAWADDPLVPPPAWPSGPPTAEQCLISAGWAPGRSVDVGAAERALAAAGFRVHDAARAFLGEFAGLEIEVPVDGVDRIKGFVHLDPLVALRGLDTDGPAWFTPALPASVVPIGTTCGHNVVILMDADGRSYLWDRELPLAAALADSPGDTIRVLCDGRNGRVETWILNKSGEPTGHVLRAGDEHRHWELGDFPSMAPYLPPESLSPCRRPPTWLAMVRSVENASKGDSPVGTFISGGGITVLGGQVYFVGPCENRQYVRAMAQLEVPGLPPGVPPTLRTGEMISLGPVEHFRSMTESPRRE